MHIPNNDRARRLQRRFSNNIVASKGSHLHAPDPIGLPCLDEVHGMQLLMAHALIVAGATVLAFDMTGVPRLGRFAIYYYPSMAFGPAMLIILHLTTGLTIRPVVMAIGAIAAMSVSMTTYRILGFSSCMPFLLAAVGIYISAWVLWRTGVGTLIPQIAGLFVVTLLTTALVLYASLHIIVAILSLAASVFFSGASVRAEDQIRMTLSDAGNRRSAEDVTMGILINIFIALWVAALASALYFDRARAKRSHLRGGIE